MTTPAVLRVWLVFAALNGLIAVAGGAYASHGLPSDGAAAALFRTAGQYQMVHALALIGVVALVAIGRPGGRALLLAFAAWAFVLGLGLFCASLYALALTGEHAFARVTPFGGIAFLLGWAALGIGALGWQPAER